MEHITTFIQAINRLGTNHSFGHEHPPVALADPILLLTHSSVQMPVTDSKSALESTVAAPAASTLTAN